MNLRKGMDFVKKVKWIAISFIVFAVYFLALVGIGFYHVKNEIVSNVHFEFFWHKSSQTYIIKGTNVSGKALEDNGEMIDVVIPTKYHGRPVTHIGWDSFRECQILRSVTIPEGIKGISANVFFDCNNLESVHLPKSMRDFYGSSFASCNSLKEVAVDPDNPWFCSVDGVVYTKDKADVIRRFQKRFEDLTTILPYCDEATFYDNENGFLAVAEYKNGEIMQIGSSQPQWLKELMDYMI